ncbi:MULTISPECIES: hypothetical protein [unclassified Haematospirillum]|uniref:hypothetical protein n=1 Tax=unclassified Haematospirillum TaxID=2622088 RepID=UPI00143ABA52|nr:MULTISPECIES: hypothetical protein [unclassified Haematospirillum]NKD55010.1 hypothetical protein [Haematospirillum sp. H4890]NKD75031.1 hypothetical protein [Haematospirillum sp. H4485]NKD88434.1 hypothetical protein [Haematospirillum sp. 15-248]
MIDITGVAVDIAQKRSSRLFWRNVLLGVFLTVLALGFYVGIIVKIGLVGL